ncbi:MAG TPA: hypothetical protein VKX28_18495 [Xanthobacteraceae bacterium]|jgi:hypothetical protein|nr:hypothetical protein [Xanthobacteraceae bacterium]
MADARMRAGKPSLRMAGDLQIMMRGGAPLSDIRDRKNIEGDRANPSNDHRYGSKS